MKAEDQRVNSSKFEGLTAGKRRDIMKKLLFVFTVVGCTLLVITGGYAPVKADDNAGTVTNIDGNVYQTVKIGDQVWTTENLRTTKFTDGSAIPLVTDKTAWGALSTPGYCFYKNTINADHIKKYGALYNWYTINPVNSKKIAPNGWHVPSDADWDILQNYLMAQGYNWDGTAAENKIAKSMAAKTDWRTDLDPGTIGNDLSKNNKTSFSALPGGYRDFYGDFLRMDAGGGWWSTTSLDGARASSRNLSFDNECFYKLSSRYHEYCGFSVRLVRD